MISDARTSGTFTLQVYQTEIEGVEPIRIGTTSSSGIPDRSAREETFFTIDSLVTARANSGATAHVAIFTPPAVATALRRLAAIFAGRINAINSFIGRDDFRETQSRR